MSDKADENIDIDISKQENEQEVQTKYTEEINEKNNEENNKKSLAKETFTEFLKSLLIGGIPTGLDYLFSAIVIFFFSLQALGYSFIDTFTIEREVVSASVGAVGTAVGYFVGFIAAYLLNIFFVFKHNKKGKTLKGILIYIAVEVFIYGFNVLLGTYLPRVLSYTFAFFVRISISYVVVFTLRKFLIFMPEKKKKT